MASEPDMMNQSLKLVGNLIDLDPPSKIGLYLGCIHHVGAATAHLHKVCTLTYGMDAFLDS